VPRSTRNGEQCLAHPHAQGEEEEGLREWGPSGQLEGQGEVGPKGGKGRAGAPALHGHHGPDHARHHVHDLSLTPWRRTSDGRNQERE
jgi:hypothetical protein